MRRSDAGSDWWPGPCDTPTRAPGPEISYVFSFQNPPMATEVKLKLALVGCGIISRHHITAAATARPRRIQITAVIDPNAERRGVAAAAVLELFGERPLEFDSLASAAAADPYRAVFSAVDIMVRVPQRAERVEGTFGWD